MKTLRIIIASLLIVIGVFGVLCGGTFAGIIGLIGFGESNQLTLTTVGSVILVLLGIVSLYISYLIIKYGIRWVKRIKDKE